MTTTKISCRCGEILGGCCDGEGVRSAMVLVEWMPLDLRSSHVAAGGRGLSTSGYWPHNGSVRLHVLPSCMQHIDRDEWVRVVRDAQRPD